jgi:predicted DNA-binding protein with PD1-like motif
MKGKLISEGAQRTFAVILDTGDEAMACLTAFAMEHRLSASHLTALGAFRDCVLGYFDWQKKDYRRIPIAEQVEVLALLGDIALDDGAPKLHLHVVVGKADGTAHGGHLLEAHAPDARGDHHRVAGPSAAPLGPGERARADPPLISLIPASGLALIRL